MSENLNKLPISTEIVRISEQSPIDQQKFSCNILNLLESIPSAESNYAKQEIIKQIHIYIKQLSEGNTLSQINEALCKELYKQIGDGKLEIDKDLLDILLAIAELGSDIVLDKQDNQFFEYFNKSKLLNKIEEIYQKEDQELNNDQFSESIIQIIQILSFINKNKYIEINDSNKYGKVLQSRICNQIQKIKSFSGQYKINNNELNMNEEIENEIRKGIKSLKALYCFIENFRSKYEFKDNMKIHETISPLIHLNCNPQLNCPQCITLPNTFIIQELQGSALKALAELISQNNKVDQYLQIKHSTFDHISSIITSFTQNIPYPLSRTIQLKQTSNSQQSNQQSISQSVIEGSINLLFCLFWVNSSLCKQEGSNLNFLKSLIKLCNFNRQRTGRTIFDSQSANIRSNINYCFF